MEGVIQRLQYRKRIKSVDESQQFLGNQVENSGLWYLRHDEAKGVEQAMKEKEESGSAA